MRTVLRLQTEDAGDAENLMERVGTFCYLKFQQMKKFSFLPLLALVIAIGASAFTEVKNNTSDIVWFKLDPDTGLPLNASSGGQQSQTDPFTCTATERPCSVALSLEDGEVIEDNGDFGIAPNVDYADPQVNEGYHYEQ